MAFDADMRYVPRAKEFVQCDRYKFWAVNIVTLLTLRMWIFILLEFPVSTLTAHSLIIATRNTNNIQITTIMQFVCDCSVKTAFSGAQL